MITNRSYDPKMYQSKLISTTLACLILILLKTTLIFSCPLKLGTAIIPWQQCAQIGKIKIKIENVKISPVFEVKFSKSEADIIKPRNKYKFVIVTFKGENIGRRKHSLLEDFYSLMEFDLEENPNLDDKTRTLLQILNASDQELEIETDKGYLYEPTSIRSKFFLLDLPLPGSILTFRLLPGESKEESLVFEIPQDSEPVKLCCNIGNINNFSMSSYIFELDKSKFIYPKKAKLSIEDYKIQYSTVTPLLKSSCKDCYEIFSIKPIVKNSGDLPIIVKIEVELQKYKEIGDGIIPSHSCITLSKGYRWQCSTHQVYPMLHAGKYPLKIIIKNESDKVITSKTFTLILPKLKK